MDAAGQSGQENGGRPSGRSTGVSVDSREHLLQRRGALRYRPWQRLRGQKAFQRERNVGVYRHSAAALIRILPPWELERGAAASGGAGADESAGHGACSPLGQPASAAAGDGETLVPVQSGARHSASGTGCRLGVVASRKVGNAVARNRAKRVWREIFRLNQQLLPADCDVLVIVRKDFAKATRAELEALFEDVARRARRTLGAEKR